MKKKLHLRVSQTKAKVPLLFLTEGLYTSDLIEPTALRLASPWRTVRNTFAASLRAKYADRSALVGRLCFSGISADTALATGGRFLKRDIPTSSGLPIMATERRRRGRETQNVVRFKFRGLQKTSSAICKQPCNARKETRYTHV